MACEKHKSDLNKEPTLEEVLFVDSWARRIVRENIKTRSVFIVVIKITSKWVIDKTLPLIKEFFDILMIAKRII